MGIVLVGCVEVDHDSIEIVLVERGGLVRVIDRGEYADARVVDGHRGLHLGARVRRAALR